jgi:hypothetical protein
MFAAMLDFTYTKERIKMVNSGSLLSTLTPRVVVSVVSGETYVDAHLLMEDDEFLAQMGKANSTTELIDWVNENY